MTEPLPAQTPGISRSLRVVLLTVMAALAAAVVALHTQNSNLRRELSSSAAPSDESGAHATAPRGTP